MGGNVRIKSGTVLDILPSVGTTTTVTGSGMYKDAPFSAFQATVVGTGTVTATVILDVSNDNTYWCATPLATITLSGTTSNADGFTTQAPFKYVRARITAISGTGATVYVTMGV